MGTFVIDKQHTHTANYNKLKIIWRCLFEKKDNIIINWNNSHNHYKKKFCKFFQLLI